jgi:hypothetical protein
MSLPLIRYTYISMIHYKSLILIFSTCNYATSSHSMSSFSIEKHLWKFKEHATSPYDTSSPLRLGTVAMGRKSLWPRVTGWSLLKPRYSGSLVAMSRRRPSLLESTVVMGVLTSAHPLLLDIKHNLYLGCKRRHNLHLIIYIKFIQKLNIHTKILCI